MVCKYIKLGNGNFSLKSRVIKKDDNGSKFMGRKSRGNIESTDGAVLRSFYPQHWLYHHFFALFIFCKALYHIKNIFFC